MRRSKGNETRVSRNKFGDDLNENVLHMWEKIKDAEYCMGRW